MGDFNDSIDIEKKENTVRFKINIKDSIKRKNIIINKDFFTLSDLNTLQENADTIFPKEEFFKFYNSVKENTADICLVGGTNTYISILEANISEITATLNEISKGIECTTDDKLSKLEFSVGVPDINNDGNIIGINRFIIIYNNTSDKYCFISKSVIGADNNIVKKFESDIKQNKTDIEVLTNKYQTADEIAINKAWQFNPRNLMDVLGTTDVKQTFAKLREYTSQADFHLLRLGDYIDLPTFHDGETNYTYNPDTENLRIQIVAFDHYYNVGETQMKTHHCVMQWKNVLRQKRLHWDNTGGGYRGTELYNYLNGTFKTKLIEYIGLTPCPIDRLLDIRNNWAWGGGLNEYVFIPSEPEVFNSIGWAINGHGTGSAIQFPLYRMWPDARLKFYNGNRWWWWLSSPSYIASGHFCHVGGNGDSGYGTLASNAGGGVSPCFCI